MISCTLMSPTLDFILWQDVVRLSTNACCSLIVELYIRTFLIVLCWFAQQSILSVMQEVGIKRKLDLYSAPLWEARLWSAQAWITQFLGCKVHHTCLYLVKRSPDGATTDSDNSRLIAAYYSFIDPKRMKGWVGLVSWPTADGLPI